MNFCLLVVALAALVCAVATCFPTLVAMRVVAGCVAGGLFPIAPLITVGCRWSTTSCGLAGCWPSSASAAISSAPPLRA